MVLGGDDPFLLVGAARAYWDRDRRQQQGQDQAYFDLKHRVFRHLSMGLVGLLSALRTLRTSLDLARGQYYGCGYGHELGCDLVLVQKPEARSIAETG